MVSHCGYKLETANGFVQGSKCSQHSQASDRWPTGSSVHTSRVSVYERDCPLHGPMKPSLKEARPLTGWGALLSWAGAPPVRMCSPLPPPGRSHTLHLLHPCSACSAMHVAAPHPRGPASCTRPKFPTKHLEPSKSRLLKKKHQLDDNKNEHGLSPFWHHWLFERLRLYVHAGFLTWALTALVAWQSISASSIFSSLSSASTSGARCSSITQSTVWKLYFKTRWTLPTSLC